MKEVILLMIGVMIFLLDIWIFDKASKGSKASKLYVAVTVVPLTIILFAWMYNSFFR